MHAASEGNAVLVGLLLSYGADTMATNDDGERPLGYACAWNQPKVATLLLVAGADPNMPEDENATYLDWATTSEHTDLIEVLSSYGALPFALLTPTGG
jgi:ankyrin repeat protein